MTAVVVHLADRRPPVDILAPWRNALDNADAADAIADAFAGAARARAEIHERDTTR